MWESPLGAASCCGLSARVEAVSARAAGWIARPPGLFARTSLSFTLGVGVINCADRMLRQQPSRKQQKMSQKPCRGCSARSIAAALPASGGGQGRCSGEAPCGVWHGFGVPCRGEEWSLGGVSLPGCMDGYIWIYNFQLLASLLSILCKESPSLLRQGRLLSTNFPAS